MTLSDGGKRVTCLFLVFPFNPKNNVIAGAVCFRDLLQLLVKVLIASLLHLSYILLWL